MTGEIGLLALCLALALASVQAMTGLAGTRPQAELARRVASTASLGLLVFVALSFGALTYASVTDDFSILNVAQNSHTLKPLIYKISGVWGNHEGSMMLWVLVLALYSGAVALSRRGKRSPRQRRARGSGPDRGGLHPLHPLYLQPVPAPRPGAVRGCRTQSAPAGSRPRDPSAHALHRLCRPFGGVLLRRRRLDRAGTRLGRARRGPSCWRPGSR
ncbi:MAG: hypothetical protein WDM81_01880 [Rhizomicrobium sp.]